ncbi:MAG: hypothetical protein H0Z38_03220 [Firmicutes bacterium]|nr:hypothetical protein [Bacillota bacterium]
MGETVNERTQDEELTQQLPENTSEGLEKKISSSKYGSRKFLVCAAILAIGTVGLFYSKLDSSDWVDLSRWVALTYLGANVFQKKVEK